MNFTSTLFFIFILSYSYGQPTSPSEPIVIIDNVDAKMPGAFNKIYEDQKNEKLTLFRKQKHLERWAYWWSSRVNADGSFPDVSALNQKAIEQLDKEFPSHLKGSSAEWESLGLTQSSYANNDVTCAGNGYGRVDRISFHPTDQKKIYACTPGGGAWYSNNFGLNWDCITNSLPLQSCAGLVVDADNTDILYLLSGTADNTAGSFVTKNGYRLASQGIFRSPDHGVNWEKFYNFSALPDSTIYPYRLKASPHNPKWIFAATNHGLFYTLNKGNTWVYEDFGGAVTDIEFHPTSHLKIYISGINIPVHYSTSTDLSVLLFGKHSWSESIGIPDCPGSNRTEIAVSPHRQDRVIAIVGDTSTTANFCGIYLSTDQGENFAPQITGPNLLIQEDSTGSNQSTYDLAIAYDLDENRILTGGLIVYQSDDFNDPSDYATIGNYWESNIGSQKGLQPLNYIHSDIHDIAVNPHNGTWYIASDGGVHTSLFDDGNTFVLTSGEIVSSQIYNMNIASSDDSKIGIGLQDNGIKIRDQAATSDFLHVHRGDGFDVDFNPTNTQQVALTVNSNLYYLPDYENLPNGRTELEIGKSWFAPVSYKTDETNTFIAGTTWLPSRYRFNNGSFDVTTTSTSDARATWEIEACPSNPNLVYVAGGYMQFRNDPTGGLWRTSTAGTTFTFADLSSISNWPTTPFNKITDIAILPDNCTKVAFSVGGYNDGQKIYYNLNDGNGWTNVSYNLPNVPVHALELQTNGTLYAGTEIGAFYLRDGADKWLPFYNNMPRVPISDLALTDVGEERQTLVASTFGRGVWQSVAPTSCVFANVVSGTHAGNLFFEASSYIESSALLEGGIGTEVDFHAGNRINIMPGFEISIQSQFNAMITGCGTPPSY